MNGEHTLSRTIAIVLCVVGLAIAAVAAYMLYGQRPATAQGEATPVVVVEPPAEVVADGYVLPVRRAALSLSVPGTVAEVYVAEGEAVAAGQPLLALESDSQAAALRQAQATLAGAEAELARLWAGPRPEETAQAEAQVHAAEARLQRLAGGATPEEVAAAQQSVTVAEASLARVQAGPTSEELTAADAGLRLAEARLRQAQAAYDKVAGRADMGLTPQALELEQATIEHERAQAGYDNLVAGATTEEVRVYEEQVAQAQAELQTVLAGANPADIAAAQADVEAARAALALVQAGARPEELAAAEAQVEAARAAVEQAQAALEATVLTAPFAGTVGALTVAAREQAAPGQPLVQLGDTRAWVVETDNLSELDVVKLAVGDSVGVTLDALPGAALEATVLAIRPAAEMKRGDVTYTVTVSLPATSLSLRWGLTAAVRKG